MIPNRKIMTLNNLTASQHEIMAQLKRYSLPFTSFALSEFTLQPLKTINNNMPILERAGLVKRVGKSRNEVTWRAA